MCNFADTGHLAGGITITTTYKYEHTQTSLYEAMSLNPNP